MKQRDRAVKVPLTTLGAGQTGIIASIGSNPGRGRSGRGRGFVKRLMDMGLTPGTKVKIIKAAPFSGPVEILVRGSRLALGRGMAKRILIEVTR